MFRFLEAGLSGAANLRAMLRADKSTDVVVVGSSNIDLIAYTDRVPGPGETLVGKNFQQGFGGKGANQAVMAARMGGRVEMLTCVGSDGFGKQTIDNYKANGVICDRVLVAGKGVPTGVAPIWVDGKGENRIIIVKGANDCILPKHVSDPKSERRAALVSGRVLLCQLEIPLETTLAALRTARENGVITIFNPAPATPLSSNFLKFSDIIAPNQSEAKILTGVDCEQSAQGPEKAAQALIDKGARFVVMTLGKDGCLIASRTRSVRVAPPKIDASQVKDTSGAGDCFLGTFASMLAAVTRDKRTPGEAKSVKMTVDTMVEAAQMACSAATLSVQKFGTQTSYPTAEEVRKFAAVSYPSASL